MVNFGGWDMPVEYSGIVAEHMATRTAAGLFDVSHMGEIEVRGPHALDLVQHVTSNDAAKLADGQAQYSGLMTAAGTFVDDLLVHRISATHYFLCVNAANQDTDFAYIRDHNRFGADLENAGERYSQLAIQGPRALSILERLTRVPLAALKYYRFTFGDVDGVHGLIARTGYTGEDGFELYFPPAHSEKLWDDLLEAGRADGLLPCGLGARNTLRLEAGLCLYGHEIDDTTTAWEANLGWICKPDKGDFLGRDALLAHPRGCDRARPRRLGDAGSPDRARRLRRPRSAAAKPAASPADRPRRFSRKRDTIWAAPRLISAPGSLARHPAVMEPGSEKSMTISFPRPAWRNPFSRVRNICSDGSWKPSVTTWWLTARLLPERRKNGTPPIAGYRSRPAPPPWSQCPSPVPRPARCGIPHTGHAPHAARRSA